MSQNLQSICGTWPSPFLGNKGVAPSGLLDEKADTLPVRCRCEMSGLLRDSGGVARDVEPGAAVALARRCASAAPSPTALGVTRFFLQKVEKCVSLKRKNQLGMLGRRGGIPPASGPDHLLVRRSSNRFTQVWYQAACTATEAQASGTEGPR